MNDINLRMVDMIYLVYPALLSMILMTGMVSSTTSSISAPATEGSNVNVLMLKLILNNLK